MRTDEASHRLLVVEPAPPRPSKAPISPFTANKGLRHQPPWSLTLDLVPGSADAVSERVGGVRALVADVVGVAVGGHGSRCTCCEVTFKRSKMIALCVDMRSSHFSTPPLDHFGHDVMLTEHLGQTQTRIALTPKSVIGYLDNVSCISMIMTTVTTEKAVEDVQRRGDPWRTRC